MDRKMYLMEGCKVRKMPEHDYREEADLQKIIADNPQLVARDWNETDENQIFLIDREMKSQAAEDEGNAYSLDHLLVDKEGVPILVEVKRSTDTRIRREVVAQMLDYACRASSLNITDLRALFERNNPDSNLCKEDEFWTKVATNLAAGRMRLVFAADEIPDTLRILIEFLDLSMGDIDVYGVEIKQFKNGNVMLLSSNIIGNSLNDPRKPASSLKTPARTWTREEFIKLLDQRQLSGMEPVVKRIMDRFDQEGVLWVSGTGSQYIDYYAILQDAKLFSLEIAHKKQPGNYCITLFNTIALSEYLGEDWSPERVKKMILSGIQPDDIKRAKERQLIWGDGANNKWLYIDLRSLRNDECVEAFLDKLIELKNMVKDHLYPDLS